MTVRMKFDADGACGGFFLFLLAASDMGVFRKALILAERAAPPFTVEPRNHTEKHGMLVPVRRSFRRTVCVRVIPCVSVAKGLAGGRFFEGRI